MNKNTPKNKISSVTIEISTTCCHTQVSQLVQSCFQGIIFSENPDNSIWELMVKGFLLMMGVLFCCGAGFFIRRRMYPPPLVEEPTFNVSYTRQPANTAAGSQQPGMPYYTDPGGPVMNPMAMAFHVQPNSPQGNPVYPPPPSYCNAPPPPYEQVVKSST
ncbi:vesicular, overexpressed in cancer, prosurvival protein 1-like [Terrapene carolina triunguis]|uniref:vesicular, overexpressed in cancer, prosurvival protein 1-like n=1 Tax=Terrapene triunguis TaxID=2587831 RepID=UPI000E77C0AC|nr:vesicular, overexpressed in cancer, prosurvival protein 1-like [Terrapene carolina triunguis]